MGKKSAIFFVVFTASFLQLLPGKSFQPLEVPGQTFRLIPESERSLHRLVVGLEANSTKAYMVPGAGASTPENKERIRRLRRELYMIQFELVHGNLLKVLPGHTRLFVAVPDPEFVVESRANEAELFTTYLKTHAGWSEDQIKKRVSFFEVPEVLLFPQDMAEILGRDDKGRLVLGVGEDGPAVYKQAAMKLAQDFPQDFQVHEIPKLNTEGGDMEIVWRPDGTIGLMVGQNRLRRYLQNKKNLVLQGRKIPPEWISEALKGFGDGFFGLPIQVLGRKELEDPRYISTEVFHIDMVVNILRGKNGVTGFVPSYEKDPVDAYTELPLGADIVRRAQRFYDEVAQDLKQSGYNIVRLPFRDHPIRNPVNVGKFTDPVTGKPTIFLAKFPYHYSTEKNKPSVQSGLQQIIYGMEDALELWRKEPSDVNWSGLEKAMEAVWKELGKVESSANPIFDAQALIYRENGINVIPVISYPSSEGGIHCLLLK